MSDVVPGSAHDEASDAVVDYHAVRLDKLIELVATPSPALAGGSVAAIAATFAAALATMTARLSIGHWEAAAAAAAQAEALRGRLAPLAREDAAAYLIALERMRSPADDAEEAESPERRDERIAAALENAAAVPLRIAEASADVAELAADIARLGNPAVCADAVTAATLARACTEAAAHIVGVNLRVASDDDVAQRAQRAVEAAEAASDRALAAGT